MIFDQPNKNSTALVPLLDAQPTMALQEFAPKVALLPEKACLFATRKKSHTEEQVFICHSE
ncbi:MAG: hypothetical protein ACPGWR_16455, partial [Ardenticatenaceae bacterium]